MNSALIIEIFPILLKSAILTLELATFSLCFGMVFSLPLSACYISPRRYLSLPVSFYVFFFRGTPLLVQIFLIYYGMAQFDFIKTSFLWHYLRDPFLCALLALTLHTTAYTTNILRGGLQTIKRGEIEAAKACGFSSWHLYRYILFPQLFRSILPAYSNEVIAMLKASSLASTITVMELTGTANALVSETFSPYEVLFTTAFIYFILALFFSQFIKILDLYLNKNYRMRF